MPQTPRMFHVPLHFYRESDGQVKIRLAPGVDWELSPQARKARFEDTRVTAFYDRYRQAGGDPQRVKNVLEGLLRVSCVSPPTQKRLAQAVQTATKALERLLVLPGGLPRHEARNVFKRAADLLRGFDDAAQAAYLKQFEWRVPTQIAFETPLGGADCSTSLISSYPVPDKPPCFPLVPTLRAPVRGRIKSGSPDGVIIGVLAEECRRRFKAPWWPDILAVCQAMAPETFYDTCTVDRLRKQVRRATEGKVRKAQLCAHHATLFPTD